MYPSNLPGELQVVPEGFPTIGLRTVTTLTVVITPGLSKSAPCTKVRREIEWPNGREARTDD